MLLLLCCLMAAASKINASVIHYDDTPKDEEVSHCVKNVIEEILEEDHFIIDVTLMNMDNVLDLSKIHGLRKARFVTRSFSWNHSALSHRIYVVSCDNDEEFIKGIREATHDLYFNPFANFIIIMNNFTNYHHLGDFLVFNNIYNVTFIARDINRDGHGIYSFHSPLHPCDHREKIVAVSHCSSYTGGTFVFPKLEAVRGCSFQLLTYNFYPLINFDDEEGVDQRIIRYFEQYASVTIKLVPYSKINKVGKLVGNFTHTDILAKVAKNEAEGAVGGYFVTRGATRFSYSYPLDIGHVIAAIPRADYLDTWRILTERAYSAVILVVVLFIFFSISAYALSLFPTIQPDPVRDILIVFGYFVNNIPVQIFKRGIAENIIASVLLLTIFMIPYTIQAYMYSFKTHPARGNEVEELSEVFQRFKLIVTSEWLEEDQLTVYRNDCESYFDCLKKVKDRHDKSLYTVLPGNMYESYKWWLADEQCHLCLYKIKEPIATLMRTIYFRRGSVLVHNFDEFLLKLVSAGLVNKHYKEIMHKEVLKCKPQYKPSTLPLTLKDLRAPFLIYVGGVFVATVSFIYEVFV